MNGSRCRCWYILNNIVILIFEGDLRCYGFIIVKNSKLYFYNFKCKSFMGFLTKEKKMTILINLFDVAFCKWPNLFMGCNSNSNYENHKISNWKINWFLFSMWPWDIRSNWVQCQKAGQFKVWTANK
jgi:hypothetical protein